LAVVSILDNSNTIAIIIMKSTIRIQKREVGGDSTRSLFKIQSFERIMFINSGMEIDINTSNLMLGLI